MNAFPNSVSEPVNQPVSPVPPTPPTLPAPDDDFEGEELGERQAGVCTLDEGCTVCQ